MPNEFHCATKSKGKKATKYERKVANNREQKRHIRKNHIKFLKAPWTGRVSLGHPAGVPAKRPFFLSISL